ncbi:glucosyltransferase [Gordonia phage Rabbitrun]|uniref:Glycosyltransferase n=1 Tax=Gordonia phage Rabbitrun TaxID=2762280 RepID=A0A7G8LIT7_9CAUD|nr:glucosyltransferase [Gordonia phage Rabbitrun]QNJ57159.1 glycosyltransferase [Gordonia phage Rabbitrun]
MKLTILTVPSRLGMATKLAAELYYSPVFVDYDLNPTLAHAHAWESGYHDRDHDDEWVGVIEDDAILADTPWVGGSWGDGRKFIPPGGGALERMLSDAPTDIVSGYLGTGRPQSNQEDIAITLHMDPDPVWLIHHRVRHHVAVFMRAKLVPRAVEHMRRNPNIPCDEALSIWAQQAFQPVSYCFPCMFDHDDGVLPAVQKEQRRITVDDFTPRRAWEVGVREEYPASNARFLDPITDKLYGRRLGKVQRSFRTALSHSTG